MNKTDKARITELYKHSVSKLRAAQRKINKQSAKLERELEKLRCANFYLVMALQKKGVYSRLTNKQWR